ncbi:hypothetical protein BDZ89DRAFT_239661 [Hymenopellis radicata]|nr:hypothetical protein BDZ89DRAFT_239661 [Hymenopellis radicata]
MTKVASLLHPKRLRRTRMGGCSHTIRVEDKMEIQLVMTRGEWRHVIRTRGPSESVSERRSQISQSEPSPKSKVTEYAPVATDGFTFTATTPCKCGKRDADRRLMVYDTRKCYRLYKYPIYGNPMVVQTRACRSDVKCPADSRSSRGRLMKDDWSTFGGVASLENFGYRDMLTD